MDIVGFLYFVVVFIIFNCDGKDIILIGIVVGFDVLVFVKFDSLVFFGVVLFFGNLFFVKGSFGKVLVDFVLKFGENGFINYVYVVGGGVESIVVVSIFL